MNRKPRNKLQKKVFSSDDIIAKLTNNPMDADAQADDDDDDSGDNNLNKRKRLEKRAKHCGIKSWQIFCFSITNKLR